MRNPIKDITGVRYSRLVVESFSHLVHGRGSFWNCRCDCGGSKVVRRDSLVSGAIRSCGCLHSEVAAAQGKSSRTHGMRKTAIYNTWSKMRQRCENPRSWEFKWYGGRGIKVCPQWAEFPAFLADMGEAPAGKSLDRIDPNGDYSPSNCRWATKEQQANNTTANRIVEHEGDALTVAQWARRTGIPAGTIYRRLYRGWSVADALSRGIVV